jgi:hypothetical protein
LGSFGNSTPKMLFDGEWQSDQNPELMPWFQASASCL